MKYLLTAIELLPDGSITVHIYTQTIHRTTQITNLEASVKITNKMQPSNRIYYSTVHWRLNMFQAAYRSSSGVSTVFSASGLHTYVVIGRSQVWVGTGQVPTQTWLRPVTTCVCKPEAANTVRVPDDERYAPRNMLSLRLTVE
jgi:hypothetical protein